MGKLIEIKLGDFRPVMIFDANGVDCEREDYVVLEVERGSEFGQIVSMNDASCRVKKEGVKGKILRKATDGDLSQIANNRIKAKEALVTCLRKINDRRLDMQMVDSEYAFDNSKIIFYFTADGRVDFRNLVKDLAKIFRVRIELKQIGVRDKARIVGGHGICGRELCCSSFMKNFHPLSIKMAKEQALPLNPSRISGMCGRIKCCMAYEFQVYKEYSKNLPHLGEKINTEDGKGRVIEVDILKREVRVSLDDGGIKVASYGKV